MSGIPRVLPEERARLAALPPDPALHAGLMDRLGFADAVDCARGPAESVGETLRVVAWNLERCRDPEACARVLRGTDVALLSEVDWGMARTRQRHTARDLAEALGWGYAYGVEFLELGLGSPEELVGCTDRENTVGYHGGAILSRHALADVRVVRLDAGGEWFDGARGERRIGGRIALLATLRFGGRPLVLAAPHLESHGEPEDRAAQMQTLVDRIDASHPASPALVGGDLNTLSLGRSALEDPQRVERALAEDPGRWTHPVAHEALFRCAARAGFEWESCNVAGEPTHRPPRRPSRRGALKLDWFLARGLACEAPEVIDALDPESGEPLSDHEAIAVTLRAWAGSGPGSARPGETSAQMAKSQPSSVDV